jgi:hypothetical protein
MAGGERVAHRLRKRRGRLTALAVLAGLTASFAITAFVPAHAEETAAGAELGAPRYFERDLPARVTHGSLLHHPTPIIVDDLHKRGFAMGGNVEGAPIPHNFNGALRYLVMYDLEHLDVEDEIPLEFKRTDCVGLECTDVWTPNNTSGIETWAIDEQRQRIYLVDLPDNLLAGGVQCAGQSILVVDYADDELALSRQPLPCPPGPADVQQSFVVASMALYSRPAPTVKKLYVTGFYTYPDNQREGADFVPVRPGLAENAGASLLVMQLDISGDTPKFDWLVDLKQAGCARREIPWVDRAGNDVLSYCNDLRATKQRYTGQNGYVVRIPVENDRPVTSTGTPATQTDPVTGTLVDASMVRTPALPGLVTPLVDRASGNLLLATADSPANGNAVWVFNPRRGANRFVGVVSAGYGDQRDGNAGFGFDRTHGRGYLLTVKGLLVAPIRHKPLPSGLVFNDILANPNPDDPVPFLSRDGYNSPKDPGRPAPIAVVSTLPHPRLIVPVTRGSCDATGTRENCPRYVVIDDYTTEPQDPEDEIPDALTQNIDEEEGKTTSNATGSGAVAAARVLITGGIPRTVNQKNVNCSEFPIDWADDPDPGNQRPPEAEPLDEPSNYEGSCLADQLVSKGNRDVSFSAASIDAGSTTGVTADAGGAVFAPGDNADDADIKRAGTCGEDNVNALQPRTADESTTNSSTSTSTTSTTAPPDPWRENCNKLYDGLTGEGVSDPRAGTRGTDGAGYPLRAVHCGDFGDAKASANQDPGVGEVPRDALSSSHVECDAASNTAKGVSTNDSLVVFTGGGVVSVARMFSSIETTRTAEGQVTDALTSARGITIGPITIGEVRAEAHTQAHGRPGTTETTYVREWCAIVGEGIDIPGCIDPDDPENQAVIDQLNDKLGTLRIELTPVQKEMTPGGYQATALKDPEAATADAAVNDDDSYSVPAMQVVFYNDGNEGRNRYIVQLANIRSESRYAISTSPDFIGDETAPPDEAPVDEVIEEAQSDTPAPDVEFETPVAEAPMAEFVELSDVEPVSDSRPVVSLPAPGRPLVERLLRVPAEIVKNAIGLLVTKPAQFALLFALWLFLATPVYLALRRRSFGQALMR